jgi:phytoene/squalene synthetase
MFSYGTSYRIATMMFPHKLRDAVLKLYSFVRIPDNMVDEVEYRNTDLSYAQQLDQHYANAETHLINHYQTRNLAYNANNTYDPKF